MPLVRSVLRNLRRSFQHYSTATFPILLFTAADQIQRMEPICELRFVCILPTRLSQCSFLLPFKRTFSWPFCAPRWIEPSYILSPPVCCFCYSFSCKSPWRLNEVEFCLRRLGVSDSSPIFCPPYPDFISIWSRFRNLTIDSVGSGPLFLFPLRIQCRVLNKRSSLRFRLSLLPLRDGRQSATTHP